MKYFRVEAATGFIRGSTDAQGAALERSLPSGQSLVPWSPDVNPKAHRWDFAALRWVARTDDAPDRSRRRLDYAGQRRTAYSELDGAQADAIMKMLAALANRATIRQLLDADTLAEFEAIAARRAAIKAANPKPST